MIPVTNADTLYQQIDMLDNLDKINLLEKIVASLKSKTITTKKNHSIKELKGLGKDLWKKIDIAEYINSERNSWI